MAAGPVAAGPVAALERDVPAALVAHGALRFRRAHRALGTARGALGVHELGFERAHAAYRLGQRVGARARGDFDLLEVGEDAVEGGDAAATATTTAAASGGGRIRWTRLTVCGTR